jgi:hypothetical protein
MCQAYGQGAKDQSCHHHVDLFTGDWARGVVLSYPFRLEAPRTPFSYEGNILDVSWCLRARADLSVFDMESILVPSSGQMRAGSFRRLEHPQVDEAFILVPGKKEEPAPDVTPPKGSWRPLELKSEHVQDEQLGSFDGLWLGSERLSPGERLPLRVRLRPQKSLDVLTFSVALVGAEVVGNRSHVHHQQDVVMCSSRFLLAGEALKLSSDSVQIPKNAPVSVKGRSCELRWSLRLELSLDNPRRVLQQLVPLQVQPRLPGTPSREDTPPPLTSAPPSIPLVTRLRERWAPNTLLPVSADIRRQLEGGIEVLEEARTRYARLARMLKKRRWQSRVQARLEVLREGIRQEPVVLETLTRLDHRARAEAWPDTEPALVLAGEVRRLRTRLEALTRERLGAPTTPEANLMEKLAGLEQLLSKTLASPLTAEETVLHQGDFMPNTVLSTLGWWVGLGLWFFVLTQKLLAAILLYLLLTLLLPSLCKQLQRLLSGRFWLTQERLIWKPTGRDAIHIPLQAIPPEGIRLLSSGHVRLELVDGRCFRLAFIEGAERLVSLLKLPRQAW